MLTQPNNGENTGLEVRIDTDLVTEPVSASEFKTYARFTLSDDDTLIAELITAARQRLEKWTGRSFGSKTITAYWNTFSKEVELPFAPITSITSVTTTYQGTNTLLVSGTDYYVTGLDLKMLNMVSVPSYRFGPNKTSLTVVYVAGYTTLPKALKEAIYKETNTAWLNRESYITDSIKGSNQLLDDNARALAQPYKIYL